MTVQWQVIGDQPVRLVSLVLVDVSSMKTRRGKALAKKRRRRVVHSSRASRMSGRACSLACSVFFVAEPEPVQQAADAGAVNRHPAILKLDAQLVQRQFAGLRHPLAHKRSMRRKLTPARRMALTAWRQRTGLAPKLHQFVHEARRHPEMTRRLPVAVTFIDKRSNTLTHSHRQSLSHRGSPSNHLE